MRAVPQQTHETERSEADLRLYAKAKLQKRRLENERRYTQHPWPFIKECVWTVDQARNVVRKYPGEGLRDPDPMCDCAGPNGGGCENYLHDLVNRWFFHDRLLVPKSRRVMASWTMLACQYWLMRYRPNSFVAIVSRKRGETDSEGSAELVKRVRFIHDHLPEECAHLAAEYQFARFRIPARNSEMVAIGQGAHQLRQYTATSIFFDEFAFWEEAQATYQASFPTLEGGGKLVIVSSANPGFFHQLATDQQT